MKRILLTGFITTWFTSQLAAADVADLIRGNAKLNAVGIVLSIIFIGIVIFLVRLDRKVSKLENKQEDPS